jgi:hypothetical protein
MTRTGLFLSAFIAIILTAPAGAFGYDVQVTMDTEFRAYEVRSPTSTMFWARRRLVDSLGLRVVQPLSKRDKMGTGPRVQAQLSLRLYQEFGETCLVADDICVEATDPSESGSYQPLARDGQIDAPLAYVEANDLPFSARISAGRQLYWDRIGFTRFDGAGAGIDPWTWLHVGAFGGALVTNNSIGGSSAFVPQGVPRLKLDRQERERAPFVEPPINTWLVGATAEVGSIDMIRVGLSVRQLWEHKRIVQQRAGVGATSRPVEPLYFQSDAIWDLADLALIDAQVSAELRLNREIALRAEGQRHVPRFDQGTIWAYFEVAPVWEEKLGATWEVTSALEVGGAVCGRHTDFENKYEHDAGIEGNSSIHLGVTQLGFSGFAWTGDLGPVWGANLDGQRTLLSWFVINGRLSLWRIDNVLRSEIKGTSLSETVGIDLRITENTILSSEISHAYSRVVGNRFWVFALLHLGAWR